MAGSTNIVVDLTNYKDKVGARVPEGTYKVIVDDAEPDTARSGNPMVNLWLRIHGGDYDGATITDRLVLTDKSMFRVVGFLQALGIPTPKKRLSFDISKFIGRSLEVTLRDGDPYNGRVKSEVSGYARLAKPAKKAEAEVPEFEEPEPAQEEEVPEVEGNGEFAAETTSTPAPEAKQQAAAPADEDPWAGDDSQGEVDLDDLNDL